METLEVFLDRISDGLAKVGIPKEQSFTNTKTQISKNENRETRPQHSRKSEHPVPLKRESFLPVDARGVTTLFNPGVAPDLGFHTAKLHIKWTAEQDEALKKAVEKYGGRNWKQIATEVPERTHIQCLQRWKKVLKPGLVKGHWSGREDAMLVELMKDPRYSGNWVAVAERIPGRTAKQCRERWCLNLNPEINHGPWSPEENRLLMRLHAEYGNRWAEISSHMPGRTENAVKTRYKSILRAEQKLWTIEEDATIIECKNVYKNRWISITKHLPGRSKNAIKLRWKYLVSINPSLEQTGQEVEIGNKTFTHPSPWAKQTALSLASKAARSTPPVEKFQNSKHIEPPYKLNRTGIRQSQEGVSSEQTAYSQGWTIASAVPHESSHGNVSNLSSLLNLEDLLPYETPKHSLRRYSSTRATELTGEMASVSPRQKELHSSSNVSNEHNFLSGVGRAQQKYKMLPVPSSNQAVKPERSKHQPLLHTVSSLNSEMSLGNSAEWNMSSFSSRDSQKDSSHSTGRFKLGYPKESEISSLDHRLQRSYSADENLLAVTPASQFKVEPISAANLGKFSSSVNAYESTSVQGGGDHTGKNTDDFDAKQRMNQDDWNII